MKNKVLTIFTLGLLSAIGPFSIDMYLPSFPAIADDFNTSISHIGLSLSSFFIGISVGQLIYGPLLDRFGRKKPLYVGLILYLIASILCAYSVDANMLILLRFFQALGSCVGMVATRALIRDLFPVEENAKIFSFTMLVIAVSPIVAPTAGGYITLHFGWKTIFLVLAAISFIILLAVYFWLPAGNKPNKEMSLLPKPIITQFLAALKVPQFYTYALVSAVSASGLYAYIAGSPLVFMGIFEVTEEQYGWIFAFLALGMVASNLINTLLLKKFTSEQITMTAQTAQVIIGFVLMTGTIFNWFGLYETIFLIWIFLCTQGFIFPNSSALAMAPFTRTAGTASALMGAIQLGIGAVATALVSVLSKTTAIPMTSVMFASGALAYIIYFIGNHFLKEISLD